LHLLPAGKVALDAVMPHVRRAQDLMLQGLSQTEGATLLRLLRKALGAVGDVSRAPSRSGPPV
jgi:MarR family transcriptional regulator, temperature-dependent positive regulator of motility